MNLGLHHAARGAAAFTLIELLIAVVVMALVLSAINGVFYGAIHMRNKTAQAIEQALPIEQTVAIIKRDLRGLVAPNGTNTTVVGQLQSGQSTTVGGDQQGGTDFYTSSGTLSDDVPWGDIQKVCYQLRNPEVKTDAGGQDLCRLVTRNLLAVNQEEATRQFLMSGVESIVFLYYDGMDWKDTWDSTTQTNGLPQAIKVQINLAEEGGSRRSTKTPIQIVVPVSVVSFTNQAAAATATQ